jgi:large conductance mechanosensitive channel
MGGFRKFLLRGNLVDLAVAVVVGVAFNQVVQALIKDLITPVIGVLGGKPNFSGLRFTIGGNNFRYGDFINVALYFLIIAAVVYYFVVVPANRVAAMAERNAEAAERPCPECLSDIPMAATRCKFCTAAVEPKANGHATAPPLAGLRPPADLRPPASLRRPASLRQWATWRPRS